MQQRKSKIILIYFFLLFFLGSINNIEFNNLKFIDIKKIKISGLDELNNSILLKKIENLNLENIFFLNVKEIKKIFESNGLVENYYIVKKYPSTLDIRIVKTNFLAKINKDGKTLVLGSNKKFSENKFSNKNLPFIFGKIDIHEFMKLKKIIDQSDISYIKIKNLYFFPSKRWDLELKNNVIMKLPKDYSVEIINYMFDFLNDENFKNIKIIDGRVNNQIILND
tara:strand:+ start:30 stop:701 length:672 start_codon:yes stop_codon:yes gene_type:complete